MWIFSKYGFFSSVCARQGDGSHGNPVDTDRIMVRARLRAHLERLAEAYPEHLGGCTISESSNTDYRFRIFVDKASWVCVVAALANELDYDNFKNEAARLHGHGSGYLRALHDVWEIGYRMQSSET